MKPSETHDVNGVSHKLTAIGISLMMFGVNLPPIISGVRAAIQHVSNSEKASIQGVKSQEGNVDTKKEK